MSWWRRDPSLSPIHRYAQRLLRSHEAVLRTRCFSRTPSKSAQHEDDDGSKRPAGMSNLEWMQLQHYNRWRKRLRDDPYRAIFGASNDMLSGKGLKDWAWISKSFPRWMVREMEDGRVEGLDDKGRPEKDGKTPGNTYREFLDGGDPRGAQQEKRRRDEESPRQPNNEKATSADAQYPKKVEIVNEGDNVPQQRESHFPQPSYRSSRFERDNSTGVASPSDLRRPREGSHVEVVERTLNEIPSQVQSAPDSTPVWPAPSDLESTIPTPSPEPKPEPAVQANADVTREEVLARESSLIEEFLASKAQDLKGSDYTSGKTWRQTALQRRSSSELKMKPESKPAAIDKTNNETSNVLSSSVPQSIPLPSPEEEEKALDGWHEEARSNDSRSLEGLDKSANQTESEPTATNKRSTPEILSQLPKDDIDFLSAADIRASMGTKRSKAPTNEEKLSDRQKLERTFDQSPEHNIDPMIESKVINDQIVRRIEHRMRTAQEEQGQQTGWQASETASATEGPIESSLDRIRRTIERSGALFASHFWQEPDEEENIKKTRLFLNKVMVHVRQGRIAMEPIAEDLEKDVPQSTSLLKRLKEHEDILDVAIRRLQQRLVSGNSATPTSNPKALKKLQERYRLTDHEIGFAYTDLRLAQEQGRLKQMSPACKRRLSIASKVANKNVELTSHLIWNLQVHLENPDVNRSILAGYQAVANNLLTLKHTQVAIARLLDRVMFMHGMAPKSGEDAEIMERTGGEVQAEPEATGQVQEPSITNEVDKASIRAKIAAEECLANEVQSQKSAMQGLSDDGYARAPKHVAKRSFDERSPLAHSLFRPFGPVLESLGKEPAADEEAAKANEAAKKKASDANLVAEIKKAYEDTYGPITVGHRQLTNATEKIDKEKKNDVEKTDTLEGDTITTGDMYEFRDPITWEWTSTPLETANAAPVASEGTPGCMFLDPTIGGWTTERPQPAAGAPAASLERPASLDSDPTPAEVEVYEAMHQREAAQSGIAPTANTNTTLESALQPRQPESEASHQATPALSAVDHPTHYTIVIHDPETNKLSITTSMTGPPRDSSPSLPLHQALATLDAPAKFVPFITEGLEIVSAKKDMLVLRDAMDDTSSTRSFETVRTSSSSFEDFLTERRQVNPIDGTTRLSPTGYVGPEESQEQLEKEFDERRQAAGNFNLDKQIRYAQKQFDKEERRRTKQARGGGAGGVVRTAIWAASICYVVGVAGDLWRIL